MLDIILPEVGEGITSGNVIGITVKIGDPVKKDQDLLELETDKASLPVPCPADGVIKEILVNEGDDVDIGSVIMRMEAGATAKAPQEEPKSPEASTTPAAEVKETSKPATVAPKPAPVAQAARPAVISNENIPPQTDVNASPAVRKLARELGVNLSFVPGTGVSGRISQDDVKVYVKQVMTAGGPTPAASAPPSKPLPNFEKFGTVRREKMTKIRKVTKDHMASCWNTIPHVTQFDKADITELDKYRKEVSTKERKITVTSFLLKVMADALKEFPQFNASIDADTNEIIYKEYVNIGVAVDTDRGLLVPVLRDLDQKKVSEITDELTAMAERARDKKTSLAELQGGSMTLTNLGGIGGYAFTPIVNWPEVCILGVSRGGFEPTWNGEKFEPRLKLPLALSYDHRLIDGADAARFLRWICEAIEKSSSMEVSRK